MIITGQTYTDEWCFLITLTKTLEFNDKCRNLFMRNHILFFILFIFYYYYIFTKKNLKFITKYTNLGYLRSIR